MQQIMISVHVPKTGGTIFRRMLEYFYGESFQLDYPWLPRPRIIDGTQLIGTDRAVREGLKGIHCIHGHFDVRKYMRLMHIDGIDPIFVTWVRDPIERTISAYHYLRSLKKPPDKEGPGERHAKATSLEQFGSEPGHGRNVQFELLHHLNRGQFSFFGCTERYAESMGHFTRTFFPGQTPPEIPHERKNERRLGDKYDVPRSVRRILARNNAEDILLYQYGRGWLTGAGYTERCAESIAILARRPFSNRKPPEIPHERKSMQREQGKYDARLAVRRHFLAYHYAQGWFAGALSTIGKMRKESERIRF